MYCTCISLPSLPSLPILRTPPICMCVHVSRYLRYLRYPYYLHPLYVCMYLYLATFATFATHITYTPYMYVCTCISLPSLPSLLQTFSPRASLIKGDYFGLFTKLLTSKQKGLHQKGLHHQNKDRIIIVAHSVEEHLVIINSQVFHETTYYYKKFIWKNLPYQCFTKQV